MLVLGILSFLVTSLLGKIRRAADEKDGIANFGCSLEETQATDPTSNKLHYGPVDDPARSNVWWCSSVGNDSGYLQERIRSSIVRFPY